MLKATNRKQEFLLPSGPARIFGFLYCPFNGDSADWAEQLGDARAQQTACKSASSQSEQSEDDTSLPVGVYTRQ